MDKKNLHIEKNVYICGEEHHAAQNTVTDCIKQIASTLLPLALFLLPIRILGQSGSYEAYLLDAYPHEHEGAVVRHWKDGMVVSTFYGVVPGSGPGWFIGIHRAHGFLAGSSVNDAFSAYRMPSGLTVNDLFVLGDTAYLCGTEGTHAVYGWFAIDTAAATLTLTLTPVYSLDTLRRLVVCRDSTTGKTHLAAIGVYSPESTNYILEVPDMHASKSQTYSLAPVNEAGGRHEETLDDLFLTDDYVVFVSRDGRDGVGPVCFRYSMPTNVLGSTLIDTYYHLSSPPSQIHHAVIGTGTEGNRFAVAYAATDAALGSKIHQMDIFGTSGIVLLQSHSTTVCGIEEMAGITYHATTGKLTLLWPDIAGYSHFLTFSPYVLGVQAASHIYPPRVRCTSLDDMGGVAFVGWGGNGVTMQHTVASLDMCPVVDCMDCHPCEVASFLDSRITSEPAPLIRQKYTVSSANASAGLVSNYFYPYCK